ncbi:family 2 encapsulin nanocompartment cargo protein polyprenyl transferase [Allonocardiopsis opalescens]|uniref:Geranylgeranyl diphosphate synthase type I n=1 Tax=Allonocardiopsis opalescens TaxID=1144618 RepID=A0A2T0Q9T9_9ACTN|nr:family 2 encapsulin nanocompartment cargo protein polyprenyl transferase [Allonocardiopsis opalescens]PRY00580.1 geranylgeranyl diphosphate synthase type I [Allonocardiopsis opalescens]
MAGTARTAAGTQGGQTAPQPLPDAAGTQQAARPAPELLAWSRSAFDPALRAAAEALPAPIRQIAGYHFGWLDAQGRPTGADGGKAIRPALVLLAAEAVGADPAAAVPAAVAVELVHDFSLLHDDVMDGDATRRHRPTAWSVFGVGPAILAGDALLTLAFDVLAASGHPSAQDGMRMLSAAVQVLIDGQSSDMAFERRENVDLAQALGMAENKTGALLGCACALGALFGGGTAEQTALLRGFGERLGLSFQLVDDLLGIWGDRAATGKPVHSDLRNRKKSLPVVAALTSGTPAGAELAGLYHREGALTEAELARAAALVELAGGRDWARRRAGELLDTALDRLGSVGPHARPAAELAELARLVVRRDH